MLPIKTSIALQVAVTASIFSAVGCASSGTPSQPPVSPRPASAPPPPVAVAAKPKPEEPISIPPRRSDWTFSYTPGQYTYTITIIGTVTPSPDSTPSRAHTVPPLTQQITFNVGDSVTIANPVLPTQLECTPQRALFSKALQLFPKIPSSLHSEMTWTDSSTVNSCSSTIPVELDVLTRYRVIGDTTYNGNAALQIEKTATFSAHGEGNQAQHRILLSASGTEIGTLYVDPNAGQLLGSATTQNAKIDITTSGRVSHFTQQTTETAIRL